MTLPSFTSGELADRFGLDLRGDADLRIDGVATLARAEPGQLAFLANSRYRSQLADSRASVVVVRAEDAADAAGTVLVARDPYTAFAKRAALFERKPAREPGIHPSAVIDPTARVAVRQGEAQQLVEVGGLTGLFWRIHRANMGPVPRK